MCSSDSNSQKSHTFSERPILPPCSICSVYRPGRITAKVLAIHQQEEIRDRHLR
jgi:hypothetical protein